MNGEKNDWNIRHQIILYAEFALYTRFIYGKATPYTSYMVEFYPNYWA